MATGAAFFADADVTWLQGNVIVDDNDFSGGIQFVEVHSFADAVAAQVHVGLGLQKQDLLALDDAGAADGLEFFGVHRDVVAVGEIRDRVKADVVAGVIVLLGGVAKAGDDIHGGVLLFL